jgi:hypothetical protein
MLLPWQEAHPQKVHMVDWRTLGEVGPRWTYNDLAISQNVLQQIVFI